MLAGLPWLHPLLTTTNTAASEIFPSSRRAKGVALTTCSNWFNNFIIGLITPPLIKGTGYGTFIFFGIFSTLSGVWAFFCVPETKGVTLEQMDRVFGGSFAKEEIVAKDEIMRMLVGGRHGSGTSIDDGKVETEWKESV